VTPLQGARVLECVMCLLTGWQPLCMRCHIHCFAWLLSHPCCLHSTCIFLLLFCSGYITSLPLVFVFGVATAVCALHRSLPYHVSSKLCNEVFHSQPSTTYLNQVLDKVHYIYIPHALFILFIYYLNFKLFIVMWCFAVWQIGTNILEESMQLHSITFQKDCYIKKLKYLLIVWRLHNLLNVLVQIANKMGLQKN
jgi:hypothetical protein